MYLEIKIYLEIKVPCNNNSPTWSRQERPPVM